MPSALGDATGTFDHRGDLKSGPVSASMKYPRFEIGYTRRFAEGIGTEAGVGGNLTEYSASFAVSASHSDYDLQNIIENASI